MANAEWSMQCMGHAVQQSSTIRAPFAGTLPGKVHWLTGRFLLADESAEWLMGDAAALYTIVVSGMADG
jgi:hypothetical protein